MIGMDNRSSTASSDQRGVPLDPVDRRLLTLIQKTFPLETHPFATVADWLQISEAQALDQTRRLREAGIIRQIGAIFDSRALGYKSTLVAMEIDPERIDRSAAVISNHPGVSHNYRREYSYNLWFTLTLPPGGDLAGEVADLAHKAGARRTHMLPAERIFKIGVTLDLEGGANSAEARPPTIEPHGGLAEADFAYVRVLQQDLPLERRPFAGWARSLGVSEDELFRRARGYEESGIMRRFAAVLRHNKAGFVANGMICWRIPEEQITELANRISGYQQVSHCVQRMVYPDWPYSVLTMVHAATREACEDLAREISREIGVSDYIILFSTREYKKERVKY